MKSNSEIRQLLYKFFSKCFYYPDEELIRILQEESIFNLLVEQKLTNRDTTAKVVKWLTGFSPDETVLDALTVEYTQLFINHYPTVLAPIYQSFYIDGELFGLSTSGVTDFYQQNGFDISNHIHEPPDHLAIELEFVYRLIDSGKRPEIQQNFIKEHILNWIDGFRQKVEGSAELPLYPYLLGALTHFLRKDVRQFRSILTGVLK